MLILSFCPLVTWTSDGFSLNCLGVYIVIVKTLVCCNVQNLFPVSFAGTCYSLWIVLAWIGAPFLIYRQVIVHGLLIINSFSDLARLHDQAEDSIVEKQHRKAE